MIYYSAIHIMLCNYATNIFTISMSNSNEIYLFPHDEGYYERDRSRYKCGCENTMFQFNVATYNWKLSFIGEAGKQNRKIGYSFQIFK